MQIHKVARRVTAALMVSLTVVSCSVDRSPTAPPAPQADLVGGLLGGVTRLVGTLLTCTPLPMDSDSALIGSAGGTLQMGPATLTIPRGALTRTMWIKGVAPRDTVNSVRFTPEGLTFLKPATLTISYSNCNLVAGLLTPKRVAYTTDNLRIIEFLRSTDYPLQRKVSGQLNHFSRYAAAW